MKDFTVFCNFLEKKVDGMTYKGDNYNRFVGNSIVANVLVGMVN